MTEKRFTRIVCSNDEYTGSLFCDDEPLKIDAVCTLLNENEQLKKEYNLANRFHSLDKSKYDAVVKENEQLRNQMGISDDTINDLISEIEQLKSENQRLSEQKHIYKQDWKHLCIDKDLLDSENEQLKSTIKGQELEIVRLHHLADAMSGVLRELDIYDVYNQEQIMKVKEKLQ